jgi:hypothetical protein
MPANRQLPKALGCPKLRAKAAPFFIPEELPREEMNDRDLDDA